MTDDRSQPDALPDADAPSGAGQIIPPEQPPMDDAAGGPQADKSEDMDDDSLEDEETEDSDTGELRVQGGE